VRTVPDDGGALPLIVTNLLRQLIEHLDENPLGDPREASSSEGQDILLDVCLDGHYYTLARSLEHARSDGITLSPRETEICALMSRGLQGKDRGSTRLQSEHRQRAPRTAAQEGELLFACGAPRAAARRSDETNGALIIAM